MGRSVEILIYEMVIPRLGISFMIVTYCLFGGVQSISYLELILNMDHSMFAQYGTTFKFGGPVR